MNPSFFVELSSTRHRVSVEFPFKLLRCRIDLELTLLAGLRVSQPCPSVSQLPAALRRPQRKQAPGFLRMHLADFGDLCRFQGPPALCVCVAAACGALATSQTRPWNFGACILRLLAIFVDIRPPTALGVCVAAACGASATSVKTLPWILVHVSCGLVNCQL